ncbi:MAG TPA: hypothetical protein VK607_05840, partial [Kofleriaceae bacterium]|nr:hypothetical protein [Kofleriaceae bacterium]
PDSAAGFAALVERARSRTRIEPQAVPPPGAPRAAVFAMIEAGELAAAAALIGDPSWRVRRAALTDDRNRAAVSAARFRSSADHHVAVAPRALAAAEAMLADTAGLAEHDARNARDLALEIREQAYFARDPAAQLGDRMTRDAFHRELRARGATVLGDPPPPPARSTDRVAVPDGRLSRVSDYVALIRDLAALTPREALAQFDLDDADYLEVAAAWAAALAADPTLAAAISAGLARR